LRDQHGTTVSTFEHGASSLVGGVAERVIVDAECRRADTKTRHGLAGEIRLRERVKVFV
jgi:hypothetical protein